VAFRFEVIEILWETHLLNSLFRSKKSRPHGPFRLSQKVGAVEKVLNGQSVSKVSRELGIDSQRLEKWVKKYKGAGKNALRFVGDPDEKPTLRDLELGAHSAFPTQILNGCQTAASFYSAQLYGKNDVIHLYKCGVESVDLVDLNAEKLESMKELYPNINKIHCEDVFGALNRWVTQKTRFDVVISDPYTHHCREAWEKKDDFFKITQKVYVANLTHDVLNGETELEKLRSNLLPQDHDFEVFSLVKRSSLDGGVYWVVFKRRR
jgi:hypothetical protein